MENQIISPGECNHDNSIFITSSRWVVFNIGAGNHTVHVCPDCGQFYIFGSQNGEHFKIEFALSTQEAVNAAGQYLKGVTVRIEDIP